MLKLCPYNQYARKLCHIPVKVTWTVGRSLCSHFLSNAPKLQESRNVGILHGRKKGKPVASPDILQKDKHCDWSLTICIVNLLWSVKSIISCITSGLPEQFLAETTGQLQVSFSYLLFCLIIIIIAVTKGQGMGISPVATSMNPGCFHRK